MKIYFIIIFFFLFITDITADGVLRLSEREKEWIKKHNVIRVSGPRAFPPFQFLTRDSKKTFQGIATDYIKLISEKVGFTIKIQKDLPWPEVLRRIKFGELDLLTCAAPTEDRKKFLNFSNNFLSYPMVVIARKDSRDIISKKDLHGKRIALVEKNSTFKFFQDDGISFIPILTESPVESLKAVCLGGADAAVQNLALASYIIEKHGLVNLRIAAPTGYKRYNLAIAMRKDWPIFVPIINKALASLTKEQHDAIRNKWIPVRYEYGLTSIDIIKWVLIVGTVGLCAVLLFVYWNRKLAQEIRKRHSAEAALKKSLSEKELLVREMHHRIKNNLAMVQSLLYLQASYAKDVAVKSQLKDAENRIKSITSIHEWLYHAQDLSNINISDYFHYLIEQVRKSYSQNKHITFEINVQSMEIDFDFLIPLAILTNEIVINSYKHAFTKTDKGIIKITLKEENGIISLCVKDNGSGIPQEKVKESTQSLGMKIIHSLVEQLQGSMEIHSIDGTEFSITIKRD